MKENIKVYVDALFIKDQTKNSLREALIILSSRQRFRQSVIIRVDGQSSLASLATDKSLSPFGIQLEVDHP